MVVLCNIDKKKMDDMDPSSDDEVSNTPPEIREAAKIASLNLLPEKSKKLYLSAYTSFMAWRESKNINSFSESILLVYFSELATKYKPSTLWAHYSMLRSTGWPDKNAKCCISETIRRRDLR